MLNSALISSQITLEDSLFSPRCFVQVHIEEVLCSSRLSEHGGTLSLVEDILLHQCYVEMLRTIRIFPQIQGSTWKPLPSTAQGHIPQP